MKYSIILIITLLSFSLSAQQYDGDRILSVEEVKKDFAFYRDLLENTHAGLYRFNNKELMTARLDSLESTFTTDLTSIDYYWALTHFSATIRCAHSFVLPVENFISYIQYGISTFPFYMYPLQGKLYVLFNGSEDLQIEPGYELVSINGLSTSQIIDKIFTHYWSDGYNDSGKLQSLEGLLFSAFYYLFVDRSKKFDLVFKNQEGKTVKTSVAPQTFNETNRKFSKNPVNQSTLKAYKGSASKSWEYKVLKDVENTAHVVITGFGHKDVNDSEAAAQKMRDFMNEMLRKLEKKNIDNLILDLRSNSGGWDAMAVELFSYLSKSGRPIRFYNKNFTMTNDPEYLKYSDLAKEDYEDVLDELIPLENGMFRLKEKDYDNLKEMSPKENRYKGDLYILIDHNTGSAAVEFAAIAKSEKTGIMVGEESGGAYEGANGGSFITMKLPESGFYIRIPLVTGDMNVRSVEDKGRGVIPDHIVPFTVEDLISRNDRQLNFVKDLIRNKK
ncbi:MAG: S41 family peptidase [Cyclobacteriaceae bacterium]